MKYSLFFTLIASALVCSNNSYADVNIGFETTEGVDSISIYDVWVDSPFRSGELKGNFAITKNPDKSTNNFTGQIDNPSEYVLGAQRSRFGSNRFGVRVDLDQPFELTPELKYVHVMIHKPKAGRVMLVGLGSRKERLDQNPFTEQFWVLNTNPIDTNKWGDAVFPIKGAEGIDIRSLVIVPDCESPHNLDEDFLFYVDNIMISDSPVSRIVTEFYPISGDKHLAKLSRKDRFTDAIKISIDDETQLITVSQADNGNLYQDLTDNLLYAKPGQTISPEISFNGGWMHAYCYVDFDRNGNFAFDLNSDGTPSQNSELVSYNYYKGVNSLGKQVSSPNLGDSIRFLPSFKIPEDIVPGFYRMRFKIDWDNIDPAGNALEGYEIGSNGGIIADAILCIYDDYLTVNDFQLNGEVLEANGSKLNSLSVPSERDFSIKVAPEKGFHNGGVNLKFGFNLNESNPIDKYGNPNYIVYRITPEEFNDRNIYTIPADKMRANLLINGIMMENTTEISTPQK